MRGPFPVEPALAAIERLELKHGLPHLTLGGEWFRNSPLLRRPYLRHLALLVVLLAVRVDLVDRQVVTVLFKPRSLLYLLWLGREIIKSNIDVTLRILDPKLRISPNVIRVKATQRSELGRVTYANSITLVPGTVAMSVEADEIIVHAITHAVAADLQSGEMDRRITELEGGF